jgi:hypothetical protein
MAAVATSLNNSTNPKRTPRHRDDPRPNSKLRFMSAQPIASLAQATQYPRRMDFGPDASGEAVTAPACFSISARQSYRHHSLRQSRLCIACTAFPRAAINEREAEPGVFSFFFWKNITVGEPPTKAWRRQCQGRVSDHSIAANACKAFVTAAVPKSWPKIVSD